MICKVGHFYFIQQASNTLVKHQIRDYRYSLKLTKLPWIIPGPFHIILRGEVDQPWGELISGVANEEIV